MTIEEKKKQLENYRAELKELMRFAKDYHRLDQLEEIIGPADTHFAGDAQKTIQEEKIRLCRAVSKLLKEKRTIERKIEALSNANYALLLKYRYLDGCTWEEVAEQMNYSFRSVHYMHNKALNDIAI